MNVTTKYLNQDNSVTNDALLVKIADSSLRGYNYYCDALTSEISDNAKRIFTRMVEDRDPNITDIYLAIKGIIGYNMGDSFVPHKTNIVEEVAILNGAVKAGITVSLSTNWEVGHRFAMVFEDIDESGNVTCTDEKSLTPDEYLEILLAIRNEWIPRDLFEENNGDLEYNEEVYEKALCHQNEDDVNAATTDKSERN